jgi:glutaredoxin
MDKIVNVEKETVPKIREDGKKFGNCDDVIGLS